MQKLVLWNILIFRSVDSPTTAKLSLQPIKKWLHGVAGGATSNTTAELIFRSQPGLVVNNKIIVILTKQKWPQETLIRIKSPFWKTKKHIIGRLPTSQPSPFNPSSQSRFQQQPLSFGGTPHLPKKLSVILVLFTGLLLPSAAFLLFIFSWPPEKVSLRAPK